MERLPDFFDHSPFPVAARNETLSGQKAVFPVEEFGKVSEFYGDGFPLIYQIKNAVVFHGGAATSAGVIIEASFFEIYRKFMDFRQYIPYYEEKFRESQECFSYHRADVVVHSAIVGEHLWDFNYQHFLIETLPRLYVLAHLPAYQELPIIVHDLEFIKQIVENLFPDRVIIYINQSKKILVTDELVFCGAVSNNFCVIPDVVIFTLNALRAAVLELVEKIQLKSINSPVYAYVGRRLLPGYAGNKRVIKNTDMLINALAVYHFECIDFDEKTLVEKAQILSSAKLIVSPIGANLMNFIFAPKGLKLIIISHPAFKEVKFFVNMYNRMNFGIESVEAFDEVEFFEGESGSDAPYVVDVAALEAKVISKFL